MTVATQQQYEREGVRLLRRASAQYPDLVPIDALIAEAGNSSIIRPSTVRRYRPSYRHALTMVESLDIESDFERLKQGLETRRGRPANDQTSTKKRKEATRTEASATFSELKRLVLSGSADTDRSHSAMAAALYVLVAPRIGLRPIEFVDARLEGTILWVRNAKRKPGQAEYRQMNLRRFSDTFLEALYWLCVLARAGVRKSDKPTLEERFEAWRNRLAEALARASKKVTPWRLSLYSFRHIALATWKTAGFSKADIAALAGHLSLDSASHYAPARHGWREEIALVEVVPQPDAEQTIGKESPLADFPAPVSEFTSQNAVTAVPAPANPSGAPTDATDAQLEWDDFPMPKAKAAKTESIDARPIFAAKADEIEKIANRIRQRSSPLPGWTDQADKGPSKR